MKNLSVNWFDLVAVIMLVIGFIRGRKRGMSEELLDVLQWLIIVVVSALLYAPLGKFVSSFTHMSLLLSYITSYVVIAIAIKLVFTVIKRGVGEKIIGSDVFGSMEYYLGTVAGAVRYLCMLIFAMAILNAKYISEAELAALAKVQKDNFGSISFPTLGSLQQDIFNKSFTGQMARRYINNQLITPTAYGPDTQREGVARRRERAVDEAINGDPSAKDKKK